MRFLFEWMKQGHDIQGPFKLILKYYTIPNLLSKTKTTFILADSALVRGAKTQDNIHSGVSL